MEDVEQHYLTVGTEVSAKYRGAFCEAKIKSVKKSVIFRVSNKKDGKVYSIVEDAIKGLKKIGSAVEAQFPDQSAWNEGVVLSAKDKSTYTVEFDDGDVRTLARTSLCLQGVRHFAEGDTLDQLPLTDPENFGTPVLNSKRKAKRKVTQTSLDINDEIDSDDQKVTENGLSSKRKGSVKNEVQDEIEEESVDEKRSKWLSDPLMGKLVLVEPSDKRKHWYPAACVNPVSIEEYDDMDRSQIVVRSFKNGKLIIVARCDRLTRNNVPSKVEAQWKDVLESAFSWQSNGSIPDVWKTDLADDDEKEVQDKDQDEEEQEKNVDFLEQLYKFMEDRGTPITKPPVLGYKDLDLYRLYNLVQEKGGFSSVTQPGDWREIYSDLGIPKITQAAGHHAKMAYSKYLLSFEEYIMSFQQSKNQRENIAKSPARKSSKLSVTKQSSRSVDESDSPMRRVSRRRKVSESLSVADDPETSSPNKEIKRARKSRVATETKRDSDADDVSSATGSEKSTIRNKPAPESKPEVKLSGRKRSHSGAAAVKKPALYKVGDKLRVKYGKGSFKLYTAKITDVRVDSNHEAQYYVHYAGWNSRHDEWIKSWRISGLFNEVSSLVKAVTRRSKTPPFSDVKKEEEDENFLHQSAPNSPDHAPLTPPSCGSENNEVSSLAKAFQDESKRISEKRMRIRRRSTSSSTPPPQPPSTKRASSVEKFHLEKTESEKSTPPEEDPASGDEKAVEKTSPSGVPVGLFPIARRKSGRRSKSPAYLRESALYGLTKRKRNNSNSVSEVLPNPEADPPSVDADDVSSESSSKSCSSCTSEANRSSPLTVWTETDQGRYAERNKKLEQKRAKKKSGDTKLLQINEEATSSLMDEGGAYDIYDEDVPNIELERSTEGGRKSTSSTENKEKSSSGKQESDCSGEEGSSENNNTSEDTSNSNEDEQSESSTSSGSNKDSDVASESSSSQTGNQETAEKTSEEQQENTLIEDIPPASPDTSNKNDSDENESSSGSNGSCDFGDSPVNQPHDEPDQEMIEEKNEQDNKEEEEREEKSVVESESDGEGAKNKQKKSVKRKPKKKKRPAPPKAPAPLEQEELSSMCPDDRIQTMMDRMEELRKLYQQLKQEVSWIDRKRKRAKRRELEAAEQSAKRIALQSPSKLSDSETTNEPSTS